MQAAFSFTHPKDWTPVNAATLAQVNKEVKKWISKSTVDFKRVKMLLIRDSDSEFSENMNVVVVNKQVPVKQATVKQLKQVFTRQFAKLGIKISDLKGQVQKIGANNVVAVEYKSRIPGNPDPLWQKQVLFAGGGKTYVVTCTALASSFERYLPIFDGILASFQVPAPK